MIDVGASGVGLQRNEVLARAFLILANAAMVVSVHSGLSEGHLVCLRREWSGWMIVGMKRL